MTGARHDTHLDDVQLARIVSRTANVAEVESLEQHLAHCDECAARASARAASSLRGLRNSFSEDVPSIEHPFAKLDDYARGALDAADREIVETHLDDCEVCTARVQQLRQSRPARWLPRLIAVAAAAAILIVLFIAIRQSRTTVPQPTPAQAITRPSQSQPQATPPSPAPPEIAQHYSDPQWDAWSREARESGRTELPKELAELRRGLDIVRGGTGEIAVVSPAGVIIDTVRPTFSWPAREGATYVVYVYDGEQEIAHSGVLSKPQWTIDRDLPRGRKLAWQVEATRGESIETIPQPPAPPALFRIVSLADHRAIAKARAEYPDDHVLHGILYARAGMIAEAKASLRQAPSTDPVAQKLLRQLEPEQ